MRTFVLALAILLLPLRGWLGDGMSVAMAMQSVQSVQATAVASSPRAHEALQMHDAHAGHESAHVRDMSGEAGVVASADTATHDCQTAQHGCNDCQLCHSVAVTAWPELVALVAPPAAAPASARTAFDSAEPAPGFKPPIS